MGTIKESDVVYESIGEGRTRYLAHTDHLMMAVIDFNDGPTAAPDPPHSHPHEQGPNLGSQGARKLPNGHLRYSVC